MYKNSISFQRYTVADADKIAVYSKLRARHAATGLDYFAKLRTSTTLALNGVSDGIGEDMLHAATVGRLEADAYMHDVAFNLPLTLASFNILLEDFGEYQKLEQNFQYSEIQTVIDDDMWAGGTGRAYTARRHEAVDPITITAKMIKRDEAMDTALFSVLRSWTLVSVCQLYAAGNSWEKITDILGYSTAAAAKMAFQRAKKKLVKAGIGAFLK